MEALEHLEAIGYTVKFYDDKVQEAFWVAGVNGESLPETVWQYTDKHKEEIRQALSQRHNSEV